MEEEDEGDDDDKGEDDMGEQEARAKRNSIRMVPAENPNSDMVGHKMTKRL